MLPQPREIPSCCGSLDRPALDRPALDRPARLTGPQYMDVPGAASISPAR
jgi:hypothetical protein